MSEGVGGLSIDFLEDGVADSGAFRLSRSGSGGGFLDVASEELVRSVQDMYRSFVRSYDLEIIG